MHSTGGPPESCCSAVLTKSFCLLRVHSTGAVDLSRLTISDEGGRIRGIWELEVACTCLNYHGNVGDAALSAALYALACVRVPTALFSDRQGEVIVSEGKDEAPLRLLKVPVSLT